MSERHACRLLGQWRGTQRYITTQRDDEDALTRAIIQLASQYGRYGYRRITVLLQRAGWKVFVWTVNRAADMRRFADWGVDGIITNRPDVAKSCLAPW